jgi:glucokinase
MIITVDVGATKTVMAQARETDRGITLDTVIRFEGRRYRAFDAVVEEYLRDIHATDIAGLYIGAAGVADGNRCEVTYLNWTIDGAALSRRFGISEVVVMNDLEAAGYGLDFIPTTAFRSINAGNPVPGGTKVLISPGTGLGMSIVADCGNRHIPLPSEGGHTGFAPCDGRTRRLWDFARRTCPRVRLEDFLSGPGFGLLYRFLVSESGVEISAEMNALLAEDPGQAVTTAAIEKNDPLATATVALFLDILANAAGDLALTGMALGGVFIGGGIVPRISGQLDHARFMTVFSDKGVHRQRLQGMPVAVVMDPLLPLYGAAGYGLISKNAAGGEF